MSCACSQVQGDLLNYGNAKSRTSITFVIRQARILAYYQRQFQVNANGCRLGKVFTPPASWQNMKQLWLSVRLLFLGDKRCNARPGGFYGLQTLFAVCLRRHMHPLGACFLFLGCHNSLGDLSSGGTRGHAVDSDSRCQSEWFSKQRTSATRCAHQLVN